MKKMNFENIKNVLSRDEMKKIMAGSGGSCCAHNADWSGSTCGVSQAEAQELAAQYALITGQHGYWCCASC
ncbi:MAG: hypothetical protein ABI405_01010 [Parafilimonas sp.]